MEEQRSLKDLLSHLEAALVPPTQHAAALPSASDLQFERTLSRPLGKALDASTAQLFSLATDVLRWVDPEPKTGAWAGIDGELVVDGVYGDVVSRVERLLEGADECIEESLGVGKKAATVGALGAKPMSTASPAPSSSSSRGGQQGKRLPAHLLRADIPKPQTSYPTSLYPPPPSLEEEEASIEPLWTPLLTEKPHAIDPSAPFLVKELATPVAGTLSSAQTPRWRYAHPYAAELAALDVPEQLTQASLEPERKPADSFETTPFEFVDTMEGLDTMMEEIEAQEKRELAVDLEHHDLRTWRGLCCLIQLSTRTKDYVIDALAPDLRSELQRLNKYFADSQWIKVFHGAQSDIVWLQRDFGLYVVGLFDTYHATVALNHPQHSLAALLARYTDFIPDKRYQLADWRIRPIPKEMLHYARADTHFLLDIYDHLRLALLAQPPSPPDPPSSTVVTPIESVFSRSKLVSSTLFSQVPYDSEHGFGDSGFRSLLLRWRKLSSPSGSSTVTATFLPQWGPGEVSYEVLREVHRWREVAAREEDESPAFVMSAQTLLRVVESRPTADDAGRLTTMGVGEIGRRRRADLFDAVARGVARSEVARDEAKNGPPSERETAAPTSVVQPVVSGLWSDVATPSSTIVQASTSSFFGGSSAAQSIATKPPSVIVASGSSFFGSPAAVAPSKASRLAAIDRVHAGFMLGGGLADSLKPRAIPSASEPEPAAASTASVPKPPTNETADHSFVPLTDRQTPAPVGIVASTSRPKPVPDPSNDDVIVVSALSSKSKGKKRKSDGVTGEVTAEVGQQRDRKKSKKAKLVPGSVAPFDYSSHTSILDAVPTTTPPAAKAKKEKGASGKKKGFEVDDSGGFGRAPRAQNQNKRGNVSQSFA